MSGVERRETVYLEPRESIRFTISEAWYSLLRNPKEGNIDELILNVWHDGERQVLIQFRGEPLVELLKEEDLFEPGREIWAERPDEDSWKVAWLDDDGNRAEATT